ncbi:hypothetical protein KM043_016857 [Ampulex compressa]|nr:hypothetical protein KM043_016857 [Ampulex compressa]
MVLGGRRAAGIEERKRDGWQPRRGRNDTGLLAAGMKRSGENIEDSGGPSGRAIVLLADQWKAESASLRSSP